MTLYSSNSVAFGQPVQGVTPGQDMEFLTACTPTSCSEETLHYVIGETQVLQISTRSLPNAVSGQPYSTTLMASGGTGGYTWEYFYPGSLPAGFALSSAGVLSSTGSPAAAAGSYSFLAQVDDSAFNVATQQLTLVVAPASAPTTLTVAPTVLNFQIQQGAPVQSQSLQIGGAAGIAWQAIATSAGDPWLSVSQAAGQIPASITAMVNPNGLTAGTYQGSIAIQAPGATPSSSTIEVTLAVTAFSGQSGLITTVAGNGTQSFSGDGGPATSASVAPWKVAVDASGNLLIEDSYNSRIRKVSAGGLITTVAGNGTNGFSGDGGPAISASLNTPEGLAVDASGNFFIADANNNRVRKVSISGIITTVAGNGTSGFSGDGGPAVSASLHFPIGVAVDASGNLFIADQFNSRIRKVSRSGIITTIAGNGTQGFSGDGGPATSASLDPFDIAVDASGNLFIADGDNNRIRKVSASGIITTVAGSGNFGAGSSSSPAPSGGFSGDGGPATSALLNGPSCVAVDASGNLFIADGDNNRIRKVSASGTITTVAGSGGFAVTSFNSGSRFGSTGSISGDGGLATAATLANPFGVAVDAAGNLFIADTGNNRVREVQTTNALGGVQNAASYATGAVSPGEIVILYGAGLGPTALATLQVDGSTGLLETAVAGTTVLFDGIPAPVVYTSASQVSVIVPYELASAATAQILVNYQSTNVAAGTVTMSPSAPGIFTVNPGQGQAAALNQDGSVNSVSNPAAAGSIIVLYLTGEGQTTPSGVNGKIASAAPYPAPVLPVTVTIGGQTAMYTYAGTAPDEVAGVMQINATIPTGVTGNAVPVSVQIGTGATQTGVTLAVH